MKKIYLFLSLISIFLNTQLLAQHNISELPTSINEDGIAPDSSAILDLQAEDKGLLIPRMNKAARDLIGSPALGLLIFQTDDTPGFYYFDGIGWTGLGADSGAGGDPTDELNISAALNGTNLELVDAGGTLVVDLSVLQDGVNDADADPSNEIQDLQLTGNVLTITNNGSATHIDLSPYLDNTDTQLSEAEVDAFVENNGYITSPDDADADPTNEYNTGVTLNGTTLEITDAGGVISANMSGLQDADWLQTNGAQSTAISNNIYTNGSVGIGISNPGQRLSVYPGTNVSAELGDAHVGYVGHNNWAGFSHVDRDNTTDYALLHNSSGMTIINAQAGQDISFRHGNVNQVTIETDGDVRLVGNNSGIVYQSKETQEYWRLVYVDNFEGGTESWIGQQALSSGDQGTTRQSNNVAGLVGHFLRPNDNNHTLKKFFDTSGMSYSEVKVEFNYLFLDSWDDETGWLAVSGSEAGNPTPIWLQEHQHDKADMELNGTTYNISFYGNGSYSDVKQQRTAQFSWSGGGFWLKFGANLDGNTDDETFGIDNIMIYVR